MIVIEENFTLKSILLIMEENKIKRKGYISFDKYLSDACIKVVD